MLLDIAKLAVHSIPAFSLSAVSLGTAIMFATLALTTTSSRSAYEGCAWRGTAPLCDGSCKPGEVTVMLGRKGSFDNEAARQQHGINPPDFGEACVTGAKVLCCRQVADPTPPKAKSEPQGTPIDKIETDPKCPAGKKWSVSDNRCVFETYKKMGRNNIVCAKNDVDIYNSPVEPRNVVGVMNGGTKGTIIERHPDGWYKIQGFGWIASDHFGACP